MEGNKDEAARCLDIARKFHSEGNLPQAIKFAKKSISLYPTDSARDLLTTYENNSSQTSGSSSSSHNSSHSSHNSHNHNTNTPKPPSTSSATGNAGSPGSTGSSPSVDRAYTQEQLEAVQRVRRLKDYYEILEISKTANEGEIKKAYRKLALIMHPDKNSAPGAEDAFKAVSKAFACLSDPAARKQYDVHGPDVPLPSHSHRHNAHYAYDTELTPEQIFEMMFGLNRQHTGTFRTYTSRPGGNPRRQQSSEPESIGALLIQFLPLIMLGLIIFFFSQGPEEPLFSLQRMNPYYYEKETHHWGIHYWVKQDTLDKLHRKSINIEALEVEVERQWKIDTERKCSFEHQNKQKMERAAYYASAAEKEHMKEKIAKYEMPNCEALRKATAVNTHQHEYNVEHLPPTLTHLTLGGYFNQMINNLPPTLTHLTLGEKFNQTIDNIPRSLIYFAQCIDGKSIRLL